jgi:hypothetical protein
MSPLARFMLGLRGELVSSAVSSGGVAGWPRGGADGPVACGGWPVTRGWVGDARLGAEAVAEQ